MNHSRAEFPLTSTKPRRYCSMNFCKDKRLNERFTPQSDKTQNWCLNSEF
jgi:hypothetical protein